MHPDLKNLIALQQVDAEIARLRQEIAQLPRRVAVIEEKLAASRTQVAAAQAAIQADETARRKYEIDIRDMQQKISRYREQSLEVKTNEQYKALMHEIDFLDREIRSVEDKILETMLDADSRQADLLQAQNDLREETAEIEKEKAETTARTQEDEAALARWNEQRNALRASTSPEALALYDRVAKARGNATAEAREQTCSACHVLLRPQKYNEIRTNQQLLTCDSCNRILYYNPEKDQGQGAAGQSSRAVETPA